MRDAAGILEQLRKAMADETKARKRARLAIVVRGREMMLIAQGMLHKQGARAKGGMTLSRVWQQTIATHLKLLDEMAATQGNGRCAEICKLMDKACTQMQNGDWAKAEKFTAGAAKLRGEGPYYTKILPKSKLEGTNTNSVYDAVRLSTVRGGQDWVVLKEKLANEDELSTREMVQAVAKARTRGVTAHLKVLESRIELTEEEKKFLQSVPMDFTLPQKAAEGERSETGSRVEVDNRRKISAELTCDTGRGIREKVEKALERAGLMDGVLSEMFMIMSIAGCGPQAWHTDFERQGRKARKTHRSIFLGIQDATVLDFTRSNAAEIAAGSAKEEKVVYGTGDLVIMDAKQAHRGAAASVDNRRIFFYMTPTGHGPVDDKKQPVTYPYDYEAYADAWEKAEAEEGKVKTGRSRKQGRGTKRNRAATTNRSKRTAVKRKVGATRDMEAQGSEQEDSDSEDSSEDESSECSSEESAESSEESGESTSEDSETDEEAEKVAAAIDQALQEVRTEQEKVQHTKRAMEKAKNTAKEVQKEMAAGLREAHGDRYHNKLSKIKWIKCVGAVAWKKDVDSGQGTAALIKTHGAEVVSAEVGEDFEWGRVEPTQTKLGTDEIRKYVRGAKSGKWYVYTAERKWQGEMWIRVISCQPGITWGLDRYGGEAAVMVMLPAAGAGLIYGTKNAEARSTEQIAVAVSQGARRTYIAYKEAEVQWLDPGETPAEEDVLFEIEPTKLVVDLTTT